MSLAEIFAAELAPHAPPELGLAVSGGGDSMALLHLAAEWGQAAGVPVRAITIDHGLRSEAANEARLVAEACVVLGVPHELHRWQGWDGQGNLQAAARDARYRLIAEWARGHALGHVALGHTRDDQAETFLMRLARGSGVDGLSAMAPMRVADGIRWLRPLLGLSRDALRADLRARGQVWAEDPTNHDPAFSRVKARQVLAALAPLGIDTARLAQTAERMGQARSVLETTARRVADAAVQVESGDVIIDIAAFSDAGLETRHRILAAALNWVGAAPYRPRYGALVEALSAAMVGERRSLHGCLVTRRGARLTICREPNAVRTLCTPTDALWDGRWRLTGPHEKGLEIRALGEAVNDTPWRDTGRARASLMASPAIWRTTTLVAAPLAGLANGWSAKIDPACGDFFTFLLSH